MTSRIETSFWMAAAVIGVMAASAGAQTTTTTTTRHTMMMMQGAEGQTSDLTKDDLFAGTEVFAKNASDVTEITMDPDSLGMVGGKDKGRAHNMILNVVRTYSYDKPGMYNMADVDAIRAKLNTGDWHCSVHSRSLKTGESTDICNKRRTDGLKETAIITVEPKELTFIHTIRKPSEGEPGGESELMMFGRMPGTTSLALLYPEAFAELHSSMASLRAPELAGLHAELYSTMHGNYQTDSAEMRARMAEAQAAMKAAQERMKDAHSGDVQRKLEDADKKLKELQAAPQ